MQIDSAETDPSASVGDCSYTAAVETNFGYLKKYWYDWLPFQLLGFDFSFRNYHAYLASVRGWEYFENKTHCKVTY